MKSLLPAFLVISLLPLHAQQPPKPNPLFPGFPMFPGSSGLLGLRSERPFHAVVETKSVSSNSYTITLKSGIVTRTFTQTPPSADELKVLLHLIVGHEYEFPKVLDEVLGKKSASTASGTPVSGTGTASPSGGSMALVDLAKCDPFRAQVARKQVGEDMVLVELLCTDGRKMTVVQQDTAKMDEARRIARLLKEGEMHEFPDDVRPLDPGKKSDKKDTAPAVPSVEMKALEGFVGEWEMPMLADPDRKLIITYLWKKDGRGLWREIRGEPKSETKRVESAWLITYDAARKSYVEVPTRPAMLPRETVWTWDADQRTLSSHTTADHPQPGTIQTSTRTLTSPDRMDWHFSSITPEGQPLNENGGHYTRVKP